MLTGACCRHLSCWLACPSLAQRALCGTATICPQIRLVYSVCLLHRAGHPAAPLSSNWITTCPACNETCTRHPEYHTYSRPCTESEPTRPMYQPHRSSRHPPPEPRGHIQYISLLSSIELEALQYYCKTQTATSPDHNYRQNQSTVGLSLSCTLSLRKLVLRGFIEIWSHLNVMRLTWVRVYITKISVVFTNLQTWPYSELII